MLNTIKQWISKNDELRQQIEKLANQNAALLTTQHSLKYELQVSSGKILEGERRAKEIKSQADVLIAATQQDKTELQADMQYLKEELDQSHQKNILLEKKMLDLEGEIQKKETELLECKQKKQTLGSTIELVEGKLNYAHTEIDEIKCQHNVQIKVLTEQIKDAHYKLTILKNSAVQETENDLSLLLQLHDVQEILAEQYKKNQDLVRKCLEHDSFWKRLFKMYPEFFDFDVEIADSSACSEETELVWNLKGFKANGVSLEPFIFKTFLSDGSVGIKLESSGDNEKELSFFPNLIAGDQKNLRKFKGITYRKYWAVIKVIEKVIQSKWTGIDIPHGIDKFFWNSFLVNLVKNAKLLPPIFRYDLVKIKRELLNQDYEHIWFELVGVNYGNFSSEKLEFRIGASFLQQGENFTRYPKIEFPLVDGRQKPFSSWYPESVDDFGPKFELRFSLDGGKFDLAVWNRLNVEDKHMIAEFVIELPSIFKDLRDQKYAITRGWDPWVKLADEIANVFFVQLRQIVRLQEEKIAIENSGKNPKSPRSISVQVNKKLPALEKATARKSIASAIAKKNI